VANFIWLILGYTLAITNSSNPADAAAYYLPTIPLISGARPSCDYCTQELFDVYYTFSSNTTLQISKNYLQAAQVVDLNCGVDYVTIGHAKSTSGACRGKDLFGWMGTVVGGITLLALWVVF